jgi:uncharacterized protein YdeI (BOF family)
MKILIVSFLSFILYSNILLAQDVEYKYKEDLEKAIEICENQMNTKKFEIISKKYFDGNNTRRISLEFKALSNDGNYVVYSGEFIKQLNKDTFHLMQLYGPYKLDSTYKNLNK